MLLPIKFVKTCIIRAESPITFLGTSSEAYGALDISTIAYCPKFFLITPSPKTFHYTVLSESTQFLFYHTVSLIPLTL
jgi:hypothetical protein